MDRAGCVSSGRQVMAKRRVSGREHRLGIADRHDRRGVDDIIRHNADGSLRGHIARDTGTGAVGIGSGVDCGGYCGDWGFLEEVT